MDWWWVIAVLFGALIVLLALGLPVAFTFLLINVVAAFFFMGGISGLGQVSQQIYSSLVTFTLAPIPLFVLMAEVIFHSGVAKRALDVLGQWLGRIPGRLSLLVVAAGTMFAALSGSTMANTAMLGSTMVEDMTARGYKKPMILGPIVGVGGLAMLIPPSNLAVILAALAQVSVSKVLFSGAIPGLILGFMFSVYVIGRCRLQPELAPPYDISSSSLSQKVVTFTRDLLPLLIVGIIVLGSMFIGLATPTEAAALGAFGSLVLAACYRTLNWPMVRKSLVATIEIAAMVFMIVAASKTYSSILAFTGGTKGLVDFTLLSGLSPVLTLILMMVIVFILGCFMDSVSIMMVTIPTFWPIITALGFDQIWFASLMLLNIEMGLITPPFGMLLFVMKSVAPKGTTMGDIILSSMPYLVCEIIVLIACMIFPQISLFLPNAMKV